VQSRSSSLRSHSGGVGCEICKGALTAFTPPSPSPSPAGGGMGGGGAPGTFKCLKCGLVQVRFATREEEAAWRRSYQSNGAYHRERVLAGFKSFDDRLQHDLALARIRMENLNRFIHEGNLLDVGTSNGALPTVAATYGFHAFGIEPDEWVVAEARARGAQVMPGFFEDYVKSLPAGLLHVVTFFDSFEHLLRPGEVLDQTHRILWRRRFPAYGGLLVLEMPDADCPAFAEQGAKWKHFKPLEHAYLYGKRHVLELLKQHRFRLLDTIVPYPDRRVYYARRA